MQVRQLSLLMTVSIHTAGKLGHFQYISLTPEHRLTSQHRPGLIHHSREGTSSLPPCIWVRTRGSREGQTAGWWRLQQSELCPPIGHAEMPQFRCLQTDCSLQTCVKYRNTPQMHSQSNSWLLLLRYTVFLSQHPPGTGSDQFAAVSQDRPADSAEKTP